MALASKLGLSLHAPEGAAHAALFGEDQARYLIAAPNPDDVIAAAQAAGLHASVVGKAGGAAFASTGLFSIPLAHLREIHEGWMPTWIEG